MRFALFFELFRTEKGAVMDVSDDLLARLEHLNDIGASLSSERNIDYLLEKILLAAKLITRAEGGTLYRVNEKDKTLEFVIVRNDVLGVALGGQSGAKLPPTFKPLSLYDDEGRPNLTMVAASAALLGNIINVHDAYDTDTYDFSGTRAFDARTGYRSRSFLTVPMKNHEGLVIAVLQLINAVDPVTQLIRSFSEADQRLAQSLASQAAVALTNRALIDQLQHLFESFIHMINIAIDEKSPHTGGHCQRVPALTMMLAEAAHEAQEGPLALFSLENEDRQELRIAALLHDCGKITTPVHVVDKATKLQTICDRIEWVNTRFALVRQQAETALWRSVAQGTPLAEAQAKYEALCDALKADCAFLKTANIGSERMGDEDIKRVKEMQEKYRWRDLDGQSHPFLSADEVENLCIRAGTLTDSERQIINGHIVATLRMLEALPWPRHLRHVPEYAGGHHERMDGKGYPRGLVREQMSWQARMMGIADIFEALTASDRPYKKAMPVSAALRIMENFRNNGHIDPDLYEIFIQSDIPRRYSKEFLPEWQYDLPSADEARGEPSQKTGA
jgi:HD-GYP domain-containing protein (c-di-GMP phosphodiesterase class II)